MNEFFLLNIEHALLKDFNDIFIFKDIDKFCYFSEKFNYDNEWNVTVNTNTKNVDSYIKYLNTQSGRRFIDKPSNSFYSIDEVDNYYSKYYNEFILTVDEYLNQMEEHFDAFDSGLDMDEHSKHKIHFQNGDFKSFDSIEKLQLFLKKLHFENIELSLFRVQVNPYKVSFKEYVDTIHLIDQDLELPFEVVDLDTLNSFINAYEKLNEISSYTISQN